MDLTTCDRLFRAGIPVWLILTFSPKEVTSLTTHGEARMPQDIMSQVYIRPVYVSNHIHSCRLLVHLQIWKTKDNLWYTTWMMSNMNKGWHGQRTDETRQQTTNDHDDETRHEKRSGRGEVVKIRTKPPTMSNDGGSVCGYSQGTCQRRRCPQISIVSTIYANSRSRCRLSLQYNRNEKLF
jgi:hypothetical protein